MKVAILGTRGVPARYGGFETFAEELGQHLVKKGFEVWVYCRANYFEKKLKNYQGIKLQYLRELHFKSLETLSHTFFSLLDSKLKQRSFDAFLICNLANSPFLGLARLGGKKVYLHVDGLEWQRSKWSPVGKLYYRLAAWLAAHSKAELIADSKAIQDYYQQKFAKKPHYIPYGAELWESRRPELLRNLGLTPGEYILQVTRFEPENNPLLTIQAFRQLSTDKKLVLVGGARYQSHYTRQIEAVRNKQIVRPGFIYERELLRELLCNCAFYVHGNEVGGTNPSLLEAMGAGCFVLARDVPFNREVLREAGIYFKKSVEDLRQKMAWALASENAERLKAGGQRAREIIQQDYQWDSVAAAYAALLSKE